MSNLQKTGKAFLFTALSAGLAFTTACSSGTGTRSTEAAAQSNKTADGKITVDFWTFWGSQTRRPVIEKIINDFNASQDKIFVKHTYVPFGDIWTKNLAAVAAGNPPDVIVNDIITVSQRAEKQQNTNLTKYLQKDNIKDRFFPELWNTTQYNNETYAIPFNTDTRLLYYNKDAFKEVGLDPEKPPTTWKELEEYAAKLDKKNGDKYQRIGFYPRWDNWDWDSWMMNADGGTPFVDKDKNVAVNTPAKVEALDWVNKWTDRYGKKNIDALKAEFNGKTGQTDPFIAGKLGMYIHTAGFYTQIRDYGKGLNFGVAPIPEKTPGSGHWSSGGGFVLEIPKGAKNADAAWEFIKYATDVQAQKYWALKNFDNVANIKASNDPELMKEPVYKAAVENLKVTKVYPLAPGVPADYKKSVDAQVDAFMTGKAKSKDALDKAQKDVEALFKK